MVGGEFTALPVVAAIALQATMTRRRMSVDQRLPVVFILRANKVVGETVEETRRGLGSRTQIRTLDKVHFSYRTSSDNPLIPTGENFTVQSHNSAQAALLSMIWLTVSTVSSSTT